MASAAGLTSSLVATGVSSVGSDTSAAFGAGGAISSSGGGVVESRAAALTEAALEAAVCGVEVGFVILEVKERGFCCCAAALGRPRPRGAVVVDLGRAMIGEVVEGEGEGNGGNGLDVGRSQALCRV